MAHDVYCIIYLSETAQQVGTVAVQFCRNSMENVLCVYRTHSCIYGLAERTRQNVAKSRRLRRKLSEQKKTSHAFRSLDIGSTKLPLRSLWHRIPARAWYGAKVIYSLVTAT